MGRPPCTGIRSTPVPGRADAAIACTVMLPRLRAMVRSRSPFPGYGSTAWTRPWRPTLTDIK
jgi:hypothetical protein